jgi:hypothetical protein
MRAKLMGVVATTAALALVGCGGGDDDSSDITAFCDKLEEVQSEDPFAGISGSDVEGAKDALAEAQDKFNEVAEVAPEEIQDDVDEAQAFFADFVEAAQDAKSPEDFISIAQDFQAQAQDFQETSQRLEQYTQENCGDSATGGESG